MIKSCSISSIILGLQFPNFFRDWIHLVDICQKVIIKHCFRLCHLWQSSQFISNSGHEYYMDPYKTYGGKSLLAKCKYLTFAMSHLVYVLDGYNIFV